MEKKDRIYVAGHTGLIGSALVRRLERDGYRNVLTRTHAELDLTDQAKVSAFFERERPDYVFYAAGKVGGVFANSTYRADFIYENVMMQCNVIHASFMTEVKKLLFLSSADAYPKGFSEPVKEEALLSGRLEATCEPFALAKICGMKMCESFNRQYGTDFTVVIPPNVYGPNQRYDALNAQVLPSLIKRFHEAKAAGKKDVVIWGTGKAVRDFLYVDDLADACLFLMKRGGGSGFFNVGTGHGYSILELAETIKSAVGFKGDIVFDTSKPEGARKKLLNTEKIAGLGWKPGTRLLDGVRGSYNAFLSELERKEVRASRIHRITTNSRDSRSLSKVLAKGKRVFTQPKSYRNKVVIKPWGYEFLVFENEQTAVWLLYISKGNSTSMHCHPKKKTSLIILSGTAMSNTLAARNYLRGGDALILDKCVFHSTKVLSQEGMYLLEIESPPMKTDLVRLEDKYGRESSGYEGVAEMKTENLPDFDYFFFDEPAGYRKFTHDTGKYTVVFEVFRSNKDFQKHFRNDGAGLITSCKGRLTDLERGVVLNTGDTQKADVLPATSEMRLAGKTVLMKTFTKDK